MNTAVLLASATLLCVLATVRREFSIPSSGDLRQDRTTWLLTLVAVLASMTAAGSAALHMVTSI
jgi:hypothetical protein